MGKTARDRDSRRKQDHNKDEKANVVCTIDGALCHWEYFSVSLQSEFWLEKQTPSEYL